MANVGVTIFQAKTGGSWFANGAHQNCGYLALLLRAGGHRPFLINGGDGPSPEPKDLPPELRGIEFVRLPEVVDDLDVLVECGAQVSAEDVARVRRSVRGGRRGVAVTMKFGNALVIDGERAIHDKPAGAIYNGARFDEVWTTSQHVETCGSYWGVTYRCPVRVLPHIWDPCLIDDTAARLVDKGLIPGYRAGRAKKRIAVLESNINLIKTGHIPMVAIEHAWRTRPDLIEHASILNSMHLRERLAFATFANNLDVVKAKADDGLPVMTFEPRYSTPWFFASHADICVSHQWIQVPNYLTYDLLHLRIPLVHNVPALRDAGCGYFYGGFDAIAGGEALLRAMTEHDGRLDEYAAAADAFLSTVLAKAPANVAAHCAAIAQLESAAALLPAA